MKKILFISALIFLFSCFQKPEIILPAMTITPDDSIIEISSISDVTFNVSGSANEDITKFKISTTPFVYGLDTTYPSFTHFMGYKAVISIPDVLPELADDSIITVSFKLFDVNNTTEIIRKLKVISGYGHISNDSGTLVYAADTNLFYSFWDKRFMKYSQISLTNFNLVLIYDATDGFVIASPNAYYISSKLNSIEISDYYKSGRNVTKINKFSTDFNQVDARFLYNLTVSGSFINDDGGSGNGVSGLKTGDVMAVEDEYGKKGILHVTLADANTKSFSFEIKFQID